MKLKNYMTDPKVTINKRITKNKDQLLDQLKKLPIIQIACEKVGVGRATYYRWRKEDKEFTIQANEALFSGRSLINDMAESQLLSQIKEQNLTAIIFWLKHNHPIYGNRLEVTTASRSEELSPDQEKIIKKALEMGSIIPGQTIEDDQT